MRCFALLLLIVLGACKRPVRENDLAPADLLPRLSQATAPDQQIALLDALSTVDPALLPAETPDPVKAVRPFLDAADPRVAAKAGDLLAHWGDRTATSGLVRLLNEPDPLIRLSAAISLSALADPAAREALEGATQDVVGDVRAQACVALGVLGQRVAAPALRERLSDPDDAVRAAAALLLVAHCVSAALMMSRPRRWPLAVLCLTLLVVDALLGGILVSGSAQPRGAAAPVVLLALGVSLGGGGWRTALVALLGSTAGVALGLWCNFTGPLLACPALSFPPVLSIETSFAGMTPIVPVVVSFPGPLSVETFLAGVPFQASTAPLFMPALTIVLVALVVGLGANVIRVRQAKAGVIEFIVAAGRLAA